MALLDCRHLVAGLRRVATAEHEDCGGWTKSEGNPNSECRTVSRPLVRISGFGILSGFGIRILEFPVVVPERNAPATSGYNHTKWHYVDYPLKPPKLPMGGVQVRTGSKTSEANA